MGSGRRRLAWLVGVVTLLALPVWLVASLSSAAARSDPHDARATWGYLQTEATLLRTLIADARRGAQAGEELIGRLSQECPDVVGGGAAGPRHRSQREREAVTPLFSEIGETIILVSLGPDLGVTQKAVGVFAQLRWSSRGLSALVRDEAREDAAVYAIRLPDLCGDLREWAAGGYETVPPGTSRFLRAYEATERTPDLLDRIWNALGPYEGPRGRALQRHVEALRQHAGRVLDDELIPLIRRAATELGFIYPPASPPALLVQPPASVVQAGGARLAEFEAGSAVAAESGCLACHRIGDSGNRGPGPDLTHIGSKLTGTQIARALIDPKAPMPSFRNLPRRKFEAVVEFLSVLR